MTGANLSDADLRGAILSGANLVGARLEGANLFKAILDGANLRNSDLSGVRFVHCAQLQAAHNWRAAYRDEDLACETGKGVPDFKHSRAGSIEDSE